MMTDHMGKTKGGATGGQSGAGGQKQRDARLVARAVDGEEDAFAELVRHYHARVIRVAYGVLGNHAEAEDVAQEAFLKVYRHLIDFGGSAAFYTWLYRIVVNVAIDASRRRRRERRADIPDEACHAALARGEELWPRPPTNHPGINVERRELRERLCAAFGELPDIHRSVMLLREVEGQSYEEIAQTLAIKKGTVMSRLFHARKTLQRCLEPLEEPRALGAVA